MAGDSVRNIKREMEQYIVDNPVSINQLHEGSPVRDLAEIVESYCPGAGIKVITEFCDKHGGSAPYIPACKTLSRVSLYSWVRNCGYQKKIIRQVTGYCDQQLYRIGWHDNRQSRLPGF